MYLTYGKEVRSTIYFVDLGSSEKKASKKQKEGFIVAGGLQSLQSLLQSMQNKMSDDDKEAIQFKDNKLTYMLKNLFKDYTKVHVIYHVSMLDADSCQKTLEQSDRVKHFNGPVPLECSQQNEEATEFNMDQLIQSLNKENFDLRNRIETLKRSHKIKMEELQHLLDIPVEIEYLLKNRDTAPEMTAIHEQRRAMEKADALIKANREIEKRLEYLASDLQELKKDKKV